MLLAKLMGSRAHAIQSRAAASGQTIEFHEPDRNAIAKFDYRDVKGDLKKQLLRFPNDEDGRKVIKQRRPGVGGWVYNVAGVGPLLYHAELLKIAGTVVVVEGERDADTLTNLHLTSRRGLVIGVTSGGAGTWHPSLAKMLNDPYRRVVILPDNDEAGAGYAESVQLSLEAEGIEHRIVSFEGTSAKDVSEFLETYSRADLVRLIGTDWVYSPDGHISVDGEGVQPTYEISI
jgi:5S rRNA maturation endonuclease (ribonuclease M5)